MSNRVACGTRRRRSAFLTSVLLGLALHFWRTAASWASCLSARPLASACMRSKPRLLDERPHLDVGVLALLDRVLLGLALHLRSVPHGCQLGLVLVCQALGLACQLRTQLALPLGGLNARCLSCVFEEGLLQSTRRAFGA